MIHNRSLIGQRDTQTQCAWIHTHIYSQHVFYLTFSQERDRERDWSALSMWCTHLLAAPDTNRIYSIYRHTVLDCDDSLQTALHFILCFVFITHVHWCKVRWAERTFSIHSLWLPSSRGLWDWQRRQASDESVRKNILTSLKWKTKNVLNVMKR